MTGGQSLAQARHESVEIDTTVEGAKRRRADMGTLIGAADGVAGRAHPLGECPALPLQCSELIGADRAHRSSYQQDNEEKPHYRCVTHPNPFIGGKTVARCRFPVKGSTEHAGEGI